VSLFSPLPPWPLAPLRPAAYNLIVADPPWRFANWSEKGEGKGAGAQYACIAVDEIAGMFPLGEIAERDCLLLCWATMPLIHRQIACVEAMGFTYKSLFVWHKVFPSGKTAMGPGYRVRSMAEPVLVATRGNPKHKAFPGLFTGVRREHSRKPEEFYDLVDAKCTGLTRRADVFARQPRLGYDSFGNEVGKFDPNTMGADDERSATPV
jgi:N6-adenosine-specific RNA methylase IME4